MSVYMISYDLEKAGSKEYDKLIEEIESYPHWHCLESSWLIYSNRSAADILKPLTPYIDSNKDKLIVAKLSDTDNTMVVTASMQNEFAKRTN